MIVGMTQSVYHRLPQIQRTRANRPNPPSPSLRRFVHPYLLRSKGVKSASDRCFWGRMGFFYFFLRNVLRFCNIACYPRRVGAGIGPEADATRPPLSPSGGSDEPTEEGGSEGGVRVIHFGKRERVYGGWPTSLGGRGGDDRDHDMDRISSSPPGPKDLGHPTVQPRLRRHMCSPRREPWVRGRIKRTSPARGDTSAGV